MLRLDLILVPIMLVGVGWSFYREHHRHCRAGGTARDRRHPRPCRRRGHWRR